MLLLWIIGLVAGLSIAVMASGRALDAGLSIAERAGLSPFVVGATVLAIGTDLPEIANSVMASATDHGDLNVGDSVGSVVTQMTFVLGLLCIRRTMQSDRRQVLVTGALIVAALAVGVWLLDDGELGRVDGLVLVLGWLIGTWFVRRSTRTERSQQQRLFVAGVAASAMSALFALAIVGAAAMLAVVSFTEVAAILDVPEYATSFFALSLGTSLPELVVSGRALVAGHSRLALGDLMGASFVDATLSLGIGPLLFPIVVSSEAQAGTLAAAGVAACAAGVLALSDEHGWRSGIVLLALYASLYGWILLP